MSNENNVSNEKPVSASPVQLPAQEIVTLLGFEIPVREYVTVGEAIELERLMGDEVRSAFETNVKTVAIFIRHRCGETVNVEDLQKRRLDDFEAFEEGVNKLIAPFERQYLSTTLRRRQALIEATKAAMAEAAAGLTGAASKLNS